MVHEPRKVLRILHTIKSVEYVERVRMREGFSLVDVTFHCGEHESKRVKSRRAPQVESAQKEREQESQGTALEVSANYSAKLKRRRGLPN